MRIDPGIDKLKREIERLEQSEASATNRSIRFQKFLDAFPFGIYIVNEEFEIEYTNALLQKAFGQPDGQKCYEYFHDLETVCPWCKNEKVFKGETVIWNWHSEKTNRDYELFDLPLQNDDGSISKIEIFNDITERLKISSERERFKLAVEQSADGIIMTDLEGVITYTNSASERIYGYHAGELVGQHVNRLSVDPQISDNCIVSQIKSSGQWRGELVQRQRDRSCFTAYLSCTVIRENGTPVALLIIIRDTTELKQKEHSLIKMDTLLKETQSLAKLGGWELDVESGQVNWTDEVFRIYGVSPDDYDPSDIGKDMSFYPQPSRRIISQAFQQALESGTPYDLELEFIRANKERIWIRTMGRPEKIDGKVVKIKGNFIDITDLKRLEQKQLRAKNLLEKVYESLDQAVFAVDPQSRKILSCNSASEKIFGYTKDEMIGKNTEFLHADRQAYLQYGKKLTRALTSGTEFHVEYSLKNRAGKIFPSEHIVKAVGNISGLPPIHVTVIKDLTFRKLAEEKLAHQQEELKNRALRLEELNAALKVLLDQREKEKKALEAGLSERLNGLIIPTINKLRKNSSGENISNLLDILEANVGEMIKPTHQNVPDEMILLSPTESTIADLIKLSYRTKEIAAKMSISSRTVDFHRENIRKKLNIKGRKINLKTYLSRIS